MKVRAWVIVGLVAGSGPALAAEPCAGAKSDHRLTVKVTDVRSGRGEVAVTLYPDIAKRFLARGGKLLRQRVKAQAPATSACFFLPQPGFYAVAVYHDANADQDFNRNLMGLPSEGFGFSNDAPTPVGLPAFSAARFRVEAGQSTTAIRMRYPR
jgi:uncharacterized protein (DUF2141 family)